MRRHLPQFALALALAGPLALATPAGAQDGGAPVAVTRAETREVVNVVRLSGSVVAPRTSRLSAALGGLVETVAVDIGDRVETGRTLVELDAELARHEVDRAQAAVREAEAELADARRRVRVAERLARRDNIPQTELDSREAAAEQAAAALARLRAEAGAARERLERHTVEAPFAGVITRRRAEPGEWVSPGTTLVELAATGDLYVDVRVPQQHYPELRDGAPVTLTFDALPQREVPAEIAALVPVSDPTARTFTLRVAPQAPEDELPLTPGMSARAALRLSTGTQGVVVPRGAVIRYPDGRTTVWVLDEGDGGPVARERQVTLGRSFDGLVHVKDGLAAGRRVVVRGNETLRPGQRVRLTENGGS